LGFVFGAVGGWFFAGLLMRLFAAIFVRASQKIFAAIRQPVGGGISVGLDA
jgi:hypothetical protein